MQFDGEQEETLVRAFGALQHGGVERGLRSSIGIVYPPAYIDMIALPLWFTRDPVKIVGFIAILNLLGLAVFFAFARRFVGRTTALWSTVLLSSMPWAVQFSRKIWPQDCLFPLVSVLLFVLFSNLAVPRRWKTWLLFALIAILGQFYLTAWFLLLPLAAFLWLARVRIPLVDVLAGLAIAVLLHLPWLAFEIRSGFDDLAWFWNARLPVEGHIGGLRGLEKTRESLLWPLCMTSGAGFDYYSGRFSFTGLLPSAPWVLSIPARILQVLTAGALFFGLVFVVTRIRERARLPLASPRDGAIVLSALVCLTVLAAYLALRVAPVPHYHVLFLPFLALLFVWSLERWTSSWVRPLIAVLALANLFFVWRFERAVAEHPKELFGRYGVPYAAREDHWLERLERGYDEVLHGGERRRERHAALAREFSESADVLLRLDAASNEPPVETQGNIRVAPSEEGLLVRGGGPLNFLSLPPIEPPPGTVPMVRVDITSPVEAPLVFLYPTRNDPEISRRQKEISTVPAGRSTQYVRIGGSEISGRMLMFVQVHRCTIHDLEIRAVKPEGSSED